MNTFVETLEQDIRAKHLSRHPFYESWNAGTVSREALQEYAKQYFHFVSLFPRLVSRVHSNTPLEQDRIMILENLMEEENPQLPHTELWIRFAEGIGVPRDALACEPLPETQAFMDELFALADKSFIEGCAALLAYEGQIPEIATLKKKGLEEHYGVHDGRTLSFFDEHGEVDIEHQKTWKRIIARHATTPEQRHEVREALHRSLEAQWTLLDGIQRAYCGDM